jgi:hypothetical protein
VQTLSFECEVTVERDLVLRLPATVTPGRHRIEIVIDPVEPAAAESDVIAVDEDVPPRTALWARLTALRDQAAQDAELPQPMSWDDVLSEVQRRRGEQDD